MVMNALRRLKAWPLSTIQRLHTPYTRPLLSFAEVNKCNSSVMRNLASPLASSARRPEI